MTPNKMECRRENEIEQTGITSKQERNIMAKEKAMTHYIAIALTHQDGDAYLKHI